MAPVSPELLKRERIASLLRASVPQNKIAELEKVSPTTVYKVKKRMEAGGNLNRKKRVTPNRLVLTPPVLKDIKASYGANKTISINKMAKIKDLKVTTLKRGLKKLGLKSRVRPRRHLLTSNQKVKRLERCQKILSFIKSKKYAKLVRIYSDEKNFTVDQAYNRRNDHCVVSSEAEVVPVMRTKHPQSCMVLGVVASDGKKNTPPLFSRRPQSEH